MHMNIALTRIKLEVDTEIVKLLDAEVLYKYNALELRDHILRVLGRPIATETTDNNTPTLKSVPKFKPGTQRKRPATLLCDLFAKAVALHKASRTHLRYKYAANRIKAFVGDEAWQTLKIEDINVAWLYDFDAFMATAAPKRNSRAQTMRMLRAVCNYAIDCEYTSYYPFRRFKIRMERTRKRNLDVETLRRLFAHQCPKPCQQRFLDMLKLIFMLRGINVVDLCYLKSIRGGRIEYIRAKTHKPYSVKVEPEAMEIIEKYRGQNYLLNYLDRCNDYINLYNPIYHALNKIKDQLGLEELSPYWMRHSWATLAASIDIPDSIIAQGLGHGGNTVTDIYIERDPKKVDAANRRLLDWVLYNKL